MTEKRTQRLLGVVTIAAAVVLLCAAPAAAQFDPTSRAFHNQTPFHLDGRHRDVACESCHLQSTYKGTPTKCFDCHWTRRQDDRYRLRLGAQCETCHRTSAWTSVQWNHGGMTGMALGAAHRTLSCQSCHQNSTFRMTQTTCIACHDKDYQATQAPNHVAAGFSTSCETCHRTSDTSFRGATAHTFYPLVGRHAQVACSACHVNNVYAGTPRDCVGCHRTLYDRTTSPNHLAAGFSPTCEGCHRAADTSWNQGTFNHRFPITSGPHRQSCATCHQTSASFAVFSCLVCHEHDRTTMDAKHRERAGYRYDSLACYSCHPNGRH
jgi:hypothetical protein